MPLEIPFFKYQGAGNDFVLIEGKKSSFSLLPDQIQNLCHRRFSIGADGIVFLEPCDVADVNMRIFNSDGSEAASCGNALLCIAEHLFSTIKKNSISINTKKGIVVAKKEGVFTSLAMPDPVILAKKRSFVFEGYELYCYFIDVGAMHVIFFLEDMQSVAMKKLFESVQKDPFFSPGANVSIAKRTQEQKGRNEHIVIRTFERGVNEETLCCSTGAVACGISAFFEYGMTSPISLHFPGGERIVCFDVNSEEIKNVHILGSAKLSYCGTVQLS